ncbi:MAG: hypothetical protein Q9207_004937 [Kuettlingeria erythrocarpa]
MPRRGVVEDSDNEDNAGNSPVRQIGSQAAAASAPDIDDAQLAGSPPPRSIPSAGPSTGSTELLNREIQDAHTTLMEPSTSRSSRSSNICSTSPSASQGSTTGFGRDKAQKPQITYRARKRQGNALLAGSSDDEEEPVHSTKRVRSSVGLSALSRHHLEEPAGHHVTGLKPIDSPANANGRIQDSGSRQAARLERMGREHGTLIATNTSMAPPASKSSASGTQCIESSGGSTIPFTDRASSPPAGHDQRYSDKSGVLDHGISAVETSTTAVSRSRKRAISEIQSPKIILGDEVPPSSSAPAESPTKRQRISSSRDLEAQSPTAQNEPIGGHDELSLSTEIPGKGKSKRANLQHNAPTKVDHADELGSDDFFAELPKENYQPRPSRSRSALTSDELFIPQDFSKRPEALAKPKSSIKAKAKAKRRRATEPEDSSQRQTDALPDFNLDTVTRSKGETGEEDLHLEVTVPLPPSTHATADEVVDPTNRPGRETSPDPPPPKKTRGRPKKGALAPQAAIDHASIEATVAAEENPNESASPTKPAEPTQAPAKRGRKRKTAIKAQEDDIIQIRMPGSEQSNAEDEGILKESNPNIQQGSMPSEDTKKEPIDYTSMTNKASADISRSPQKKSPVGSKGEGQTTPVKNGSVQQETKSVYRVGLSKRQRIPSLLKVVRK